MFQEGNTASHLPPHWSVVSDFVGGCLPTKELGIREVLTQSTFLGPVPGSLPPKF